MTGMAAMRSCFDAVTVYAARILGLDGYGLEPGCNADFVVLQARDPVEAIRLRAARLYVVRRGKVIAESPPQTARLHLPVGPTAPVSPGEGMQVRAHAFGTAEDDDRPSSIPVGLSRSPMVNWSGARPTRRRLKSIRNSEGESAHGS